MKNLDRRTAISISAGVLLIVFASPLLLVCVGIVLPLDWAHVTNVGQSYTGISAILSALALLGVVYSINLQSRQVDIARSQAVRAMQFDLLRLAMNEAKYATVIQPTQLRAHDHDKYSVDVYRTQWLRYLQFSFLSGEITATTLRSTLANNILHTDETRDWWDKVEPIWTSEGTNAPQQCLDFLTIVRETCDAGRQPSGAAAN